MERWDMEFVFICPQRGLSFKSPNFGIIENRGVLTDAVGNKTLDARVRLTDPCPFCGQHHIYSAHELACPFDGAA
jgi:hypothetical protein